MVMALLDEVLDDFVASREREGGKLAEVIGDRATAIAAIAAEVRTLVPLIRIGQRNKLDAHLADLSQPPFPSESLPLAPPAQCRRRQYRNVRNWLFRVHRPTARNRLQYPQH